MPSMPVSEYQILEAVRQTPTERWDEVLAFVENLRTSGADAFQVKSIAQSRFVQRLGTATSAELDAIATAVSLVVGRR